MKIFTYTFVILTTFLCTAPAMAQRVNKSTLDKQVDTALQRAQAQQADTCTCAQESLSIQELIEAEEELQYIRDTRDSRATREKYAYLFDPKYRRHKNGDCPTQKGKSAQKGIPSQLSQQTTAATPKSTTEDTTPLDTRELIDAETELTYIRNTWDINATFEKYPYLLNPAYRRANEAHKTILRRQYTQSTWARKVGL